MGEVRKKKMVEEERMEKKKKIVATVACRACSAAKVYRITTGRRFEHRGKRSNCAKAPRFDANIIRVY